MKKLLYVLIGLYSVGILASNSWGSNCVSELAQGVACQELHDQLQGNDGVNGTNGQNGQNGNNGVNGKDGKNGAVGPAAPVKAALLTDFELRLFDTRYFSMFAFDSYQLDPTQDHDLLKGAHNSSYGAKFVFKLGRDYTEDRLDKQAAQIKALEARLNRLSR